MIPDAELLRRYAREGTNEAFAEVVRRHIDFVYSIAMRQLHGDAHLAADATQKVFADLARKAAALENRAVLSGWLFTSTRYTAANLVRRERRRLTREQEAHLMSELSQEDPAAQPDWHAVRPVLDDVIGELSDADREAILLRFFEGQDYATIGARLTVSDNTARMRVERALEKLRTQLEERGVTSTSAALAAALAQPAVLAAPAGLAAAITGAALAGGGVAAGVGAGTASAFLASAGVAKLQLGVSGALAAAALSGVALQHSRNETLRAEIAEVQTENATIGQLRRENDRLSRVMLEAADLRQDDRAFAHLQEEAAGLKTRLQQLARAAEARAKASSEIVDLSRLDLQPRPQFQARPKYPIAMKAAGITAEVVVDFIVDANGNVKNAYAIRSKQRTPQSQANPASAEPRGSAGPDFSRKGASSVVATAAPAGPDRGHAPEFVELSPFVVATAAPAPVPGMNQGNSTARQESPEFEAAAVEAIEKWKFKPGVKRGRNVNTHMQVPIVFTLSEDNNRGRPPGN